MSEYVDRAKRYLKSVAELAAAGFAAGAGEHVVEHGLDFSAAALQGLAVAGLLAAYGVVVKKVGDDSRASAVK